MGFAAASLAHETKHPQSRKVLPRVIDQVGLIVGIYVVYVNDNNECDYNSNAIDASVVIMDISSLYNGRFHCMASLRQTFAHNLRRLREERGWSQDELATRLQTDRTSISRIERLAPNVALDKVALLALAFGIDARGLLATGSLDARHTSARGAPPTPQLIGAAVRSHRESAGISQRELGDRVGLDRNHISRIEVGSTNIALDTLEKVASALGVSAADLLEPKKLE